MSAQARILYPEWFRQRTAELQRQGLTFTEIAKTLKANRLDVVQVLYWEAVSQ